MSSSTQSVPLANPPGSAALGTPIPDRPHSLSVSLPTWESNVGWATRNEDVVSKMHTGYPRFFVHPSIIRLAGICSSLVTKEGQEPKSMIIFPSAFAAVHAVQYFRQHSASSGEEPNNFSHVTFNIDDPAVDQPFQLELHGASFPPSQAKLAKSFWQHTGLGMSSRYAERILSLINTSGLLKIGSAANPILLGAGASEEKLMIRRRLCALYPIEPAKGQEDAASPPDGLGRVSTDDVYLYPTGMSAIFHIHQACMSLFPARRSVSFGFAYTDTFKVLEKWGPGAHLLLQHPDQNLRDLESILSGLPTPEAGGSPLAAIFCELPSNPLLLSANLPALSALAIRYNVPLILDNTVGDPITVDALEYVDVMVTSLSKMFSGRANVMGGSIILKKESSHYAGLKRIFESSYADHYYHEDAIVMEENSRDFSERVQIANVNATAICEFIHSWCAPPLGPPGGKVTVIKDIFFPKFVTRDNFDLVRRKTPPGKGLDAHQDPQTNFGTLFTLSFTSLAAAGAFFDALDCAKGPSLGTNFTLSCPYTLLGHYDEREWAAGYGVLEEMVRVSVGLEDIDTLKEWFAKALEAAQQAA